MNVVSLPRLHRALAARRRLVVAVLVALAVLFGLAAVRPPAPPTVRVLAAARDLAAGSALGAADLRAVALPVAAVPAGALRPGAPVLGRLVAGPVRRGEPLTDVRLVGPSLLAAVARGPDVVAVPVRFADAGVAALLRPGDRIDVLAAPDGTLAATAFDDTGAGAAPGAAPRPSGAPPGTARVVASDVLVVLVAGASPDWPASPSDQADPGVTDSPPNGGDPAVAAPGNGLADGALVVVACPGAVARALAAAAATDRLSPALRPPVPAAAGPPTDPPADAPGDPTAPTPPGDPAAPADPATPEPRGGSP